MNETFWGGIIAIGGVATPVVILWRRHVALRHRVSATRPPTEAELQVLRQRGRLSVFGFVSFWVVALGLILAVSLLQAPPAAEALVLIGILTLVACSLWFHLNTRCPICNYRLGYQRSLGVPARCERCGASFS